MTRIVTHKLKEQLCQFKAGCQQTNTEINRLQQAKSRLQEDIQTAFKRADFREAVACGRKEKEIDKQLQTKQAELAAISQETDWLRQTWNEIARIGKQLRHLDDEITEMHNERTRMSNRRHDLVQQLHLTLGLPVVRSEEDDEISIDDLVEVEES